MARRKQSPIYALDPETKNKYIFYKISDAARLIQEQAKLQNIHINWRGICYGIGHAIRVNHVLFGFEWYDLETPKHEFLKFKIQNSKIKPVYAIDLVTNEKLHFKNITEASEFMYKLDSKYQLRTYRLQISRALNRDNYNVYKGFLWSFNNQDIQFNTHSYKYNV
jgi:hypothetical protein